MARRPDTPCAGGCGVLLWGSTTSLPAGERMCRSCRKARPKKPPMQHSSICRRCEVEFFRRDQGQQFCSLTCVGMSRRKSELPNTRQPCIDCGLVASRRGPRCKKCAGYASRTKPLISKVYFPECLQCGAVFASRRSLHVPTCSEACRRAEAAKRTMAKYVPHPRVPRVACDCGASLERWTKTEPHRRLCDDCKRAGEVRSRAQAKRRRRARKRGAVSEPYTLAEIALRDGNRCGICRRKVRMKRAVPDPKAPTIDHIVPLGDGGDDTRVNVQLACFLCNSIKGAGGVQQLALIG